MIGKLKPSTLEQLESISKQFEELEYYESDVCGNDYTDAIFYSKMKDLVDKQIDEINYRMTSKEKNN